MTTDGQGLVSHVGVGLLSELADRSGLTLGLSHAMAKTRDLDDLVLTPWIEQFADALIGPHTLSSVIAIQIGPGEVAQEIHYDAAAYPLPRSYQEVVFNIMWALDDFTAENGATVLYPQSNHWPETTKPRDVESIRAVMPAGSMLVWPGRTFHGGDANQTDRATTRRPGRGPSRYKNPRSIADDDTPPPKSPAETTPRVLTQSGRQQHPRKVLTRKN